MPLFGPPNIEKMKARRDVNGLIKALGFEKDSEVRSKAAGALGELKDTRAVEPLIAALKDKSYYVNVREGAAEALVKIGAQLEDAALRARVMEPFIAALKDSDSNVRFEAIKALGKICDARAVPSLIATLNDDWNVCNAAVEALVKIGTPAVEPLVIALKDRDWVVARNAAEALEKIGWLPGKDEASATYYWIAMEKWDDCVKIGAPAVEPLIRRLNSVVYPDIAGEALGKIGAPAVNPLIAALKDPNEDVRKAAAEALGNVGDARAVEPLISVFKYEEKSRDVQKAVARALVNLYKAGQLDEADKKLILAHRNEIIGHSDYPDRDDCGSPAHGDIVSVDFPL